MGVLSSGQGRSSPTIASERYGCLRARATSVVQQILEVLTAFDVDDALEDRRALLVDLPELGPRFVGQASLLRRARARSDHRVPLAAGPRGERVDDALAEVRDPDLLREREVVLLDVAEHVVLDVVDVGVLPFRDRDA